MKLFPLVICGHSVGKLEDLKYLLVGLLQIITFGNLEQTIYAVRFPKGVFMFLKNSQNKPWLIDFCHDNYVEKKFLSFYFEVI